MSVCMYVCMYVCLKGDKEGKREGEKGVGNGRRGGGGGEGSPGERRKVHTSRRNTRFEECEEHSSTRGISKSQHPHGYLVECSQDAIFFHKVHCKPTVEHDKFPITFGTDVIIIRESTQRIHVCTPQVSRATMCRACGVRKRTENTTTKATSIVRAPSKVSISDDVFPSCLSLCVAPALHTKHQQRHVWSRRRTHSHIGRPRIFVQALLHQGHPSFPGNNVGEIAFRA